MIMWTSCWFRNSIKNGNQTN